MIDDPSFRPPAATGMPAPSGVPDGGPQLRGLPDEARRRPTGFERNDEPDVELSWWERLPQRQRVLVVIGCVLALVGIAGGVFGARGLFDSSSASADAKRLTTESSDLSENRRSLRSEAFAEVSNSLRVQAAVDAALSAATEYRSAANRVIELSNTAVDLQIEGQATQADELVQGELSTAVNDANSAEQRLSSSLRRIREELG